MAVVGEMAELGDERVTEHRAVADEATAAEVLAAFSAPVAEWLPVYDAALERVYRDQLKAFANKIGRDVTDDELEEYLAAPETPEATGDGDVDPVADSGPDDQDSADAALEAADDEARRDERV